MLFSSYVFADYSGAQSRAGQRRAIRVATAEGPLQPRLVEKGLTRDELVDELLGRLRQATRQGMRVCFGQDHQYGIPVGLGHELGLAHMPWREALNAFCDGSYATPAPRLGHASTFARAFNSWLEADGRRPYFHSATKSTLYGIPSTNPRPTDNSGLRLTEMCRPASMAGTPKPFNRLGDNGTVGGQTLVGLLSLQRLLAACNSEKIPVAAWPFDGLSITDAAYSNSHVLLEPYPTAIRGADIPQTDSADAFASVANVQVTDRTGVLQTILDLSTLDEAQRAIVRFEGWIFGHVPGLRTLPRRQRCATAV